MTRRVSPDTVIVDLTLDDDPEEERQKDLEPLRQSSKRKFQQEEPRDKRRRVSSVKQEEKKTQSDADSDDEEPIAVMAKKKKRSQQQEEGEDSDAEESSKMDDDKDDDGDDDCCVVAAPAKQINAAATGKTNGDDDIELVGTANALKLPHMRQHCTEFPFSLTPGDTTNHKFCDLCYCYVCDKPASECSDWNKNGPRVGHHCQASDTGPRKGFWKARRTAAANPTTNPLESLLQTTQQRSQPEHPGRLLNSANNTFPTAIGGDIRLGGGKLVKRGPGPFPPTDAVAKNDPNLTSCRKCGYLNRYFHRNFTHYRNLHPVGFLDWCHWCGCVASEKDFGKKEIQSKPYQVQADDIYLGEKTIPFTLFAHDPRVLKAYKKHWEELEKKGVACNEEELQHDLFQHRLGERPTLRMILASVPIHQKVNPKNVSSSVPLPREDKDEYEKKYRSKTSEKAAQQYQRVCCRGDKFAYWQGSGSSRSGDPSMDELEGIHLENEATDLVLLSELYQFDKQGLCNHTTGQNAERRVMGYNLKANWDKESQSGSFSLKIYLRPNKSGGTNNVHFASFSKLFGAWYSIFPFPLSDICGTLQAKPEKNITQQDHVVLSNSNLTITKRMAEVRPQVQKAVQDYNETIDARREHQTLAPSCNHQALGGTCPPNLGLENVLKRFFSEVLVDDILRGRVNGKRWIDLGQVSSHRKKNTSTLNDVKNMLTVKQAIHELNYVRQGDLPLAVVHLREHAHKIWNGTKSLKGIIDHCENLGHAKIPFFEGLNVELLEFQKESVQWALERETMEGGVQSMLWPKLPHVGDQKKTADLWFNPVLESVRSDKPKLCRGGILAEEMGLGKTVISLALILNNPAPERPASGTLVSSLDKLEDTGKVTWDKDLHSSTSTLHPKRGKIISRGTLVVCKVSLVGQWIAEAKSKLEDPGMVYSYHGSNRKRDPKILAKNAVVVTTYETLQSDNNYFRNKANDSAKYCPPIEQIRWWRIICDESHEMGNPNTQKTEATKNLHSDHRWLVSGTPIVSSLTDLKNQMKFIGIEHVDEIFCKFSNLLAHAKDRQAKQKEKVKGRVLGHFMYFLRSLMMRHSQKQTYRGTDTTLMSLPPKTERVVEVDFDEKEREEYKELQSEALQVYSKIRASKKKLGKSYLKLKGTLKPLQIACAGGHIPIDDATPPQDDKDGDGDQKMKDAEAEESDDGDDEEEIETSGKNKKVKKVQQFSDFAFTSKCQRLIKELKEARDKDPSSKSLVFSQFASSIKFLQSELPKHGFEYRTLSGDMSMKKRAKALDDFMNDPPTTIFLLSMRAAAVGINLTQANRVFLLEPSFNPAMVKQAIGRVYRLGQKRSVEIIRLVVKDSVDTGITKMLANKHGDGDEANGEKDEDDCLVGSLKEDKTEILTEEFDLLFGYEGPKEPKEEKKTTKTSTKEEPKAMGEEEEEDFEDVGRAALGGGYGDSDDDDEEMQTGEL